MSYESMVNKLIEAGLIPLKRKKYGRTGVAEFGYWDIGKDLIVVSYMHEDYGLVTEVEYGKELVIDMYEGLTKGGVSNNLK